MKDKGDQENIPESKPTHIVGIRELIPEEMTIILKSRWRKTVKMMTTWCANKELTKKKKKSQDLGNTCGSGWLEKKLKKRHIIKYDVNHYRENWKILTEDEQTYLQCRKFNLGVERRLAWRETRQSKSRKQREEWPTVEMTGTWIMAVVAACGRQKNLGGTKEILRKNIYRLDTEEMSWP